MKVTKHDGANERVILTGMITSTPILTRIAGQWDKRGLFRSRSSNVIAQWCVDHCHKYGKAPNRAIEGLFRRWAERSRDKETADMVERFLSDLSGAYARRRKELDVDHVVDLAVEHFNRTKLIELSESLTADADHGDIEKALTRVHRFQPVSKEDDRWVHLLHDRNAVRSALTKYREPPLITYPGGLGNFFLTSLRRDAFIALQGTEKSGKSYWLLDIAWRAIKQKQRVAFFQVGDLSQDQVVTRFVTRAMRRPLDPKPVLYPKFIEVREDQCEVQTEERMFKRAVNSKLAMREFQSIAKMIGDTEAMPLLKLCCRPNASLSIHGVKALLQSQERKGWKPDIIIIDYADILAPPAGIQDERQQINYNWQTMRSLSQEMNCLLVTATQSNAAAYKSKLMDRSHFSGSKLKHAHVSGMIALNVSTIDKEQQVTRLNWLDRRDLPSIETLVCYSAGCISLANPAVLSSY